MGRAIVACPGRSRSVAALVYAIISARSIHERTEELAWLLAALYGANQVGRLGETLAGARKKERGNAEQTAQQAD